MMESNGRFGGFGGVFVPQILFEVLEELEKAFIRAQEDDDFQSELKRLWREYAGRPTPLYPCSRLCANTGCRIFLKREDLVHGGAHKTNQVLAQGLLAKRMGKTRLIAETGAGQHGVAVAMVGALMCLKTRIYMGAKDVDRQRANVFRMRLMGAEVMPVWHGSQTLKEAINETLRDWAASFSDTHYLIGTVTGPHPFPLMVREYQRVIGREAREQILRATGRLPDEVIACVGGGSNAMGIFADFIQDESVKLTGVEAAGHGLETGKHCASLQAGRLGILHGARTFVLQDQDGQILESHSIAPGLDYPGVGPEHTFLCKSGRASYVPISDSEALLAFRRLSAEEGIIPALESAHALAYAIKRAESAKEELLLLVNLSGRGDKDMEQISDLLEDLS